MTYALMSTLVHVSSERPQDDLFHKAGLQDVSTLFLTDVNVTRNVASKASSEEGAHV